MCDLPLGTSGWPATPLFDYWTLIIAIVPEYCCSSRVSEYCNCIHLPPLPFPGTIFLVLSSWYSTYSTLMFLTFSVTLMVCISTPLCHMDSKLTFQCIPTGVFPPSSSFSFFSSLLSSYTFLNEGFTLSLFSCRLHPNVHG